MTFTAPSCLLCKLCVSLNGTQWVMSLNGTHMTNKSAFDFIWPVLDVHLPRTLGQGISPLMNEANRRLFKQIHVQLPIDHSLSLWLQENTKDRRIVLKLNKLWVLPHHLSFFKKAYKGPALDFKALELCQGGIIMEWSTLQALSLNCGSTTY